MKRCPWHNPEEGRQCEKPDGHADGHRVTWIEPDSREAHARYCTEYPKRWPASTTSTG